MPPQLLFFQQYLEQLALAPLTIRNYLADVKAFARWQEERGRSIPDAEDLSGYLDHLTSSRHSPATINRQRQTLRLYGRFLHECGYALENPAHDLTRIPSEDKSQADTRTLSAAEVEHLRAAIRSTARAGLLRRDLAIVELILQAGLRVAEVAALRTEDLIATRDGLRLQAGAPVDQNHDQENTATRNTLRRRQVPINGTLAQALREYLGQRPPNAGTSSLFLSQQGTPLSARAIQRLIETYARTAGLEGVSANTLRHTCARNWLAAKHERNTVAQWLGCRQIESLQKYR